MGPVTIALIGAGVGAAIVGGTWFGSARAERQQAPAATIAQVSSTVNAALKPVMAEQANISEAIEASRLDRHCATEIGETVNARAVGCLYVECSQRTAALGQSAAEGCADIRHMYLDLVREELCEDKEDAESRDRCYAKVRQR